METFGIIVSGILMLAGIVGCFLPVLPGLPLCFISLLFLDFTLEHDEFTAMFFMAWAMLIIVVGIVDYLVPVWGTKWFGGSAAGRSGSTIGLILGIFIYPPLGLIIGPLLGAFLGELTVGRSIPASWKAAFGTLAGLMAGTLLKLALAGVMVYYYFDAIL